MKLKRCPFCGTADKLDMGAQKSASYRAIPPYFVLCLNCFAQGPDANNLDKCRELWNQRFNESENAAKQSTTNSSHSDGKPKL